MNKPPEPPELNEQAEIIKVEGKDFKVANYNDSNPMTLSEFQDLARKCPEAGVHVLLAKQEENSYLIQCFNGVDLTRLLEDATDNTICLDAKIEPQDLIDVITICMGEE